MNGIGRVLMEDWHCDRELPPYDRVTMDGIAIYYDEAIQQLSLKIDGVVAAGDPQATLVHPAHCLEVMTGAMLPLGADTVIRYEDLDISGQQAVVSGAYRKGQNVHTRGSDRKHDELLVPAGTQLSSSEIGVGAAIGKSTIEVSRQPRTIIISTGNELVEVDQVPLPHQIRRGNVYRLQASLKHMGLHADTDHIIDDAEVTTERLRQHIADYDLIILSGGVSKGKFDFLPAALEQCGVEKKFHRVAQRPGKPLWFGVHPEGTTVFALPGNPISSFMCQMIYVIDWVRRCCGLHLMKRPMAVLSADIQFKPALTYFMVVSTDYNNEGVLMATPQPGNGSGDLANLVEGDAFIRLPADRSEFYKGEVFSLYTYR